MNTIYKYTPFDGGKKVEEKFVEKQFSNQYDPNLHSHQVNYYPELRKDYNRETV